MDTKTTAERLKLALDRKNMKAVDLSERSGVNKASISLYLSGKRTPTNMTAAKMGKVLGVNPVWLMGFDVPMNSETLDLLIKQTASENEFSVMLEQVKPRDEKQLARLAALVGELNEAQVDSLIQYAEFIKDKGEK